MLPEALVLNIEDPAANGTLRLVVFVGILVLMGLLEAWMPRRDRVHERPMRWFTNLSMVAISGLAVRVIFPGAAAIGVALWAESQGYGLFALIALPGWIEGLAMFALLDLAIYAQHVATHKIPILWRLHRVHHADPDIDASTGIRFHPIEIILSMAYKMFIILLLGGPAIAVFLFEVVLNGSAMFNHANFKLPLWLDRILRVLIVTPDMHRVHHSVYRNETDANYGFNLSIWDRVFRTYIPQPKDGHTGMTIGLPNYQDGSPRFLGWSLLLPFKRGDQ